MGQSAHEFIGDSTVEHLQLPKGSEQCFATMLTGYARLGAEQIAAVNAALVEGEVSDTDGSTSYFIAKSTFDVRGTQVVFEPIVTPFNGVEQVDEIISEINDSHRAGSAVALLYNRAYRSDVVSAHWLAVSGHTLVAGVRASYRLLDPSENTAENVRTTLLEDMVRRSTETMGVFAYAMSRAGVQKP